MTKRTASKKKPDEAAVIFRVPAELKDQFEEYCSNRGLIQKQILEALMVFLIDESQVSPELRDRIVQTAKDWRASRTTP